MKTTTRILSTFCLAALIPLAALADTLEERFERTLPFASGQTLTVSNTNGSVNVEAWDRDEIEIVAEKKVRARDDELAGRVMEALEIDIDDTGDGIRIETMDPRKESGFRSWLSGRDVSASVSYTIRLPRRADLDLDTVNGKISVEGVHGNLDLGSTNGGIKALRSGGTVKARTTNGGIDVELDEADAGEEMSFRTTNGGIELSLPAHFAADVTARTTNGSIHTDLPITVQGSFGRHRIEGSINGGGASIDLRTTNGSIRIREL